MGFINTGCGNVSAVELADKWLQRKQEAERETSRVRRFKLCVLDFPADCRQAQGETGI